MTIAIVERPKEDFATGDVMRTDTKYKGRFRTEDVGEPGGMMLTIGKLKGDVERVGRRKASTKVQRVLVSKGDFTEVGGDLVPMSAQGERELNLLRGKYGKLIHVGGDYFVPQSEYDRFKKLKYFENPRGGKRNMPKYRKGISSQEASGARRRGVPESIIQKMLKAQELTIREKDILNSKGLGYKVGFTKADKTKVRSHTFALKTKYGKRSGKKRGGGGGSSDNPNRSPIEVKPGLPRGAYS